MGKTIGILSLKGGVGKTSSVVALGAAIAGFGKRVLLVDGNFSSPCLGLHLNIIDPEVSIHHVLNDTANINDSIYEVDNIDNLDIIPASIFHKININPLSLRNKIKNKKKNYDYIIIDSSPSLNEETLGVMVASDEILIVTTPDHPTLISTIKAVKLAKQRGTPINGLILNKVHNKNFEISIKDIEELSEVPVMAVIPYDINILKAVSELRPYTEYKPKSEGSIEYKKLAATLIGEKYKPLGLMDLIRKLNLKKQDVNREIFYQRVFK